jgi:hypothetical protein
MPKESQLVQVRVANETLSVQTPLAEEELLAAAQLVNETFARYNQPSKHGDSHKLAWTALDIALMLARERRAAAKVTAALAGALQET